MSLTVKDIYEKKFQRSFKGYNEDEVDQFLDQIIEEVKALLKRIKELEGRNAELAATLGEEQEHSESIKATKATIMHTLVSAQKSSERIMSEAARKAEVIIDSAQTTAKQRAAQMDLELEETKSKIADLRSSATVFAASFTNLINTTAAAFSEQYTTNFKENPSRGGINAQALSKINKEVADGLKNIAEEPGNGAAGNTREPVAEQSAVFEAPAAAEELAVFVEPAAAKEPVPDREPDVLEESAEPDVLAAFAAPEAAGELGVIEEPAAQKPKASEEPVITGAPDVFKEFAAMEKAAAAKEPAAVEEPVITEAPAVFDEPAVMDEPVAAEKPPKADKPADAAPAGNGEARNGLMELHEINRALSDLESGEDMLPPVEAVPEDKPSAAAQFSDYKQKYNDYSWLYESDGKPGDTSGVKEPEDKDELKSLIDEIID